MRQPPTDIDEEMTGQLEYPHRHVRRRIPILAQSKWSQTKTRYHSHEVAVEQPSVTGSEMGIGITSYLHGEQRKRVGVADRSAPAPAW